MSSNQAKSRDRNGDHAAAEGGTRERIVRAAVQMFQANGYHGAGLADILKRARAPKGSLYHHFPGGKEDLALAALDWIAGEVDPFLEQLLEQEASGSEMVCAMARHYAESVACAGGMRATLVAVLAQDAVPGSDAIREALSRVVGNWSAQLAAGFRQEGVRDPDAVARRSLALLEGATILARIEGDPTLVLQMALQKPG